MTTPHLKFNLVKNTTKILQKGLAFIFTAGYNTYQLLKTSSPKPLEPLSIYNELSKKDFTKYLKCAIIHKSYLIAHILKSELAIIYMVVINLFSKVKNGNMKFNNLDEKNFQS